MAYLIGTDEAGYGPNLGPLVISASVWRIPDDSSHELYALLRPTVAAEVGKGAGSPLVVIADSKQLYKPKQSLQMLENGLLSCLLQRSPLPVNWRDAWQLLTRDRGAHRDDGPWNIDYNSALPVACDPHHLLACAAGLRSALRRVSVELVEVRAVAIFPREFNSLCNQFGGKGAVLTNQTLSLLAELVESLDGHCHVVCDKHGGRNRYAAPLLHYFCDDQLLIEAEGRQESRYRLVGRKRTLSISFCTGGERFLPAALASMASKYLRELAMMAFNAYWLAAVPKLRPTAGYPVDALRFRREIAPVQHHRGIADSCLWRMR